MNFFTIILFFISLTVFGGSLKVENISIFSPEKRIAIDCNDDNDKGLTYTSFNNFIQNPNIPGAREKDERKFAVAKLCSNGDCNDGWYYNTLPDSGKSIKEGDRISISIYFHNNAEDPYDGGDSGSSETDATNVKIGIDISDINDKRDEYFFVKHPKGFIYADNAEYRTSRNNSKSVIKDSLGNIVRTVTDDVQIVMTYPDLEFKTTSDISLRIAKTSNILKKSTTITINTEDPKKVFIKVTPKFDDTKMWIEFDKIPGSFPYSGFAIFELEVVKKKMDTNVKQKKSSDDGLF